MYTKDGNTYYPHDIRALHPNVSFCPTTYAELGYEAYVAPPAPPETAEQIQARLTNAVQAHLDTGARVKGYDNIVSACSYAAAPNAFQTEGLAYLAWRADVWSSCYTLLAAVQQGQIAVPTEAELIAQLPASPY